MGSTWGNKFKISIFGESHGVGIGAVIDGLPPGIFIDLAEVKKEMSRRSAKGNLLATPRKEEDEVEILSGLFNNKTTGAPLAGIIRNGNTRSKDYEKTKDLMRPGHADYTGAKRYQGYQDYRGGGHFSGRLTAPFVFAGAIAKAVIKAIKPEVEIGSRVFSIGKITDVEIENWKDYLSLNAGIHNPLFPLVNSDLEVLMKNEVIQAIKEKDSVGGIIEGFVTNLEPGIGNPFFESIESRLAGLLFSIPGVKGVSFGKGFDITSFRGSEVNDPMKIEQGKMITKTNNNGGINGGISNGMPITFQVAIKPTPSISQKQETVNLKEMKDTILEIEGRHDPCIVLRAFPVVEAATAICLADFLI